METLIVIIMGLLIALYKIANRMTDNPQGTAREAWERGAKQMDEYYQEKYK